MFVFALRMYLSVAFPASLLVDKGWYRPLLHPFYWSERLLTSNVYTSGRKGEKKRFYRRMSPYFSFCSVYRIDKWGENCENVTYNIVSSTLRVYFVYIRSYDTTYTYVFVYSTRRMVNTHNYGCSRAGGNGSGLKGHAGIHFRFRKFHSRIKRRMSVIRNRYSYFVIEICFKFANHDSISNRYGLQLLLQRAFVRETKLYNLYSYLRMHPLCFYVGIEFWFDIRTIYVIRILMKNWSIS